VHLKIQQGKKKSSNHRTNQIQIKLQKNKKNQAAKKIESQPGEYEKPPHKTKK